MKLLLVPMVGGRGLGPIFRCLSVAEEANKYFDIAFLCKKEFKRFFYEKYLFYDDILPIKKTNQGNILLWNDAAYAMGLCDNEFVQKAFQHQLNIVREYEPDIIFAEYNLTILLVAQVLKIPIVSTVNWADTAEFTLDGAINEVQHKDAVLAYNKILEKYNYGGYKDISDLATSIPHLVAPTLPELQPELLTYNPVYSGSLLCNTLELGSDEIEIDDNNIYVYLTSCDIETEIWFPVIIRELSKLNLSVYIVSNQMIDDMIDNERIVVPPDFHLARFWPSLRVLQKSKLVIHAGSANIIAGALLNGVPSVMFPMNDGERLYNAKAVERKGGGSIIDEECFLKVGGLYDFIQRIAQNDMYNIYAMRLGKKILSLGGSRKVVELMMDLTNPERTN